MSPPFLKINLIKEGREAGDAALAAPPLILLWLRIIGIKAG
jgi:hypothetical protein